MPDTGSSTLVQLVTVPGQGVLGQGAIGTGQPTCSHPDWCDRSRCVRHDNDDVNHRSAVQSLEVCTEFGDGGRIEFWIYRYDEKLHSGEQDTGDADVVAELVNPAGQRTVFFLDPAALGALGAMVTGLQGQEPALSAPGVSHA